jgi:mono/diheme cytochrome c family protein
LGQQLRTVSRRYRQGGYLTDPKKQASFTDAQATAAIKDGVKQNGKTTMKAFGGKLSADEIKALVTYVRTLKK